MEYGFSQNVKNVLLDSIDKDIPITNNTSTENIMNRSSHQRLSRLKVVLRNSTIFTGKHLCQSLFFNNVASLRPVTLLKRRLWHRCFPVNFVKFLRTPFLQNTSRRLLLHEPSKFSRIDQFRL